MQVHYTQTSEVRKDSISQVVWRILILYRLITLLDCEANKFCMPVMMLCQQKLAPTVGFVDKLT